ncbi:hypothetical protein BC833DRAFT_443467 [Globomyces pollinis-pini]|nr:hypothetical protein BC833DRAFT_443467 [Globomyces pollinis-pini]
MEKIKVLESQQNTSFLKDSEVMQESVQNSIKLKELEDKIKLLCKEKVDWTVEKDSLLSDFRMREMQLKNLNSDEVRKLSGRSSASSSVVNSPILSRSDSNDRSFSQQNSSRNSISRIGVPDPEPEYLKHVVLKFLEANKKSQRSQLINVLAMLLKFDENELKNALKFA